MGDMRLSDRIRLRWKRLFERKEPFPWETRESARLLEKLSRDPWACATLASILEIETDPGESAADYIAQSIRQYVKEVKVRDAELRLERARSTP